jgi:hypothetical protein
MEVLKIIQGRIISLTLRYLTMVYNKFLLLFWKSSIVTFYFKRIFSDQSLRRVLPKGLTEYASSPWETEPV